MSTPATDLFEALVSAASGKTRARSPDSQDTSDWARQEVAEAPVSDTRTYRGRTIDELIPQIQAELGSDAIIVRRREGLTGGIAGFFQHQFVEVEAVPGSQRIDIYDEEPPLTRTPPPPPRPKQRNPGGLQAPYSPESLRSRGTPSSYVAEHLAALASPESPMIDAPERPPKPPAPERDFLELTAQELSQPEHREAPQSTPVEPLRQSTQPPSRARTQIEQTLLSVGVSEQFASELILTAATHVLPLAPRAGLARAVRSTLVQRIPVAPPLPSSGAAIVIVGPGGAGKTSCVAALLGAYRKSSTLPASCATLAREPHTGDLQMLLSPHLMSPTPIGSPRAVRALQQTRAQGMVIVDTVALSAAERSGVRKLSGMLTELNPERVVIALPATLGAAAATQLLEALRPLRANALALTHADETDQLGIATELSCKFALAPEFLLDRRRAGGWRLTRIDPTDLAARLLG